MSLTRRIAAAGSPAIVALGALTVIHAVYFTAASLRIHFAYATSTYDFALYEQGVWLLSRFESPFVTLMGRHLFGDHSSFVLLLIVPVYWLVDWSGTLFVAQAVAMSLAAIPVFGASRAVGLHQWPAVGVAAVYLLHPAVGWTALENFHPDAFLAPFVATALWAAITRRPVWYWVAVALALSVKEDVAVVLVPVGLWLMWRGERRRGVLTVTISAAASLVMLLVVMRSFTGVAFRNSWRIPFGGFRGLLETTFRDPIAVWRHFTTGERLGYLLQMIAPVGAVFLRAPSLALTAAGVLFVNVLSTFIYQFDIRYHYSLVAVPSLVIGTAWAVAAMQEQRRRVVLGAVIAAAVLSAWLLGPLPGSRVEAYPVIPSHPAVAAADEIVAVVPADVSLSAFHTLAPHLARRREIYMFPNPFVRTLFGVDVFTGGDRLPAADSVEWVVLPLRLDDDLAEIWAREAASFREVARNEWWAVYARP